MKCEYCGTDNQKDVCEKCGAKVSKQDFNFQKSDPFFYNGYVVYILNSLQERSVECQLWLGRELIERIKLPFEVLEKHVSLGYDMMPFFWDLFLVAHGEKEVLEYQEKNDKYPATFEIRRIENPNKERWDNMSISELANEFRR